MKCKKHNVEFPEGSECAFCHDERQAEINKKNREIESRWMRERLLKILDYLCLD